MTTRGIDFLTKHGIDHQVVRYAHDAKGARFAAQAIGFPLDRTVKTLVVRLDNGEHILALVPGNRELSLKTAAKAMGAKRGSMAQSADAQRLTGYRVGGISPFGTRKALPVIMDAGLCRYDQVMVNAGQRGVMVLLAPEDMVRVLRAIEIDW